MLHSGPELTLFVQTELAALWHRDRSAALEMAGDFRAERSVLDQLSAIERRRADGLDPYAGIPLAVFAAPVRPKSRVA